MVFQCSSPSPSQILGLVDAIVLVAAFRALSPIARRFFASCCLYLARRGFHLSPALHVITSLVGLG